MDEYCTGPEQAGPTPGVAATAAGAEEQGPFAECVLCREPTEYPQTHRGITLCPRCEWLEAQRSACSG
ncbi:hypothetical protein ACFV0R_00740 [Streptomyces sp. NPDC059578]|uniref:hypothetical protein n=1 Tax=Streptomyces sp. NPDC059578 TaxID=3346874 RepID=UPI003680DEF5